MAMAGDEPVHRFHEYVHDREPREASEDAQARHDVGDPDDGRRTGSNGSIRLDHMERRAQVV
jgi:hypothetical protein